jgi:dihydrodipicolinate synthase/N-acetylneuraminate lyase
MLTFAALAAGVRAVVWGIASIVPAPCVELLRLLIDEIDLPAARERWARLWPLCRFLEGQSYPAAVKTACRLAGDATGPVRPPLLPLGEGATRELTALLDRVRPAATGAERRHRRAWPHGRTPGRPEDLGRAS